MTKNDIDTPMMRQYFEIKGKHQDKILLFRLGDFYEMFFDDATEASKILDIALTSRNKSSKNPVPLCGVPYHSVKSYIAKLIKAGKRVAICEQMEDPAKAKGIVRREVTRIITPGINIDETILDSDSNNYLLSYQVSEKGISIVTIDISTEELKCSFKESPTGGESEIIGISPSEIVISNTTLKTSFTRKLQRKLTGVVFTYMSDSKILPIPDIENPDLQRMLNDEKRPINHAIETLFSYLRETHSYSPRLLSRLQFHETCEFMSIDPISRANLELIDSTRDREATLFSILNFTQTPMARRKLKNWILYPLLTRDHLENRLESVNFLFSESFVREDLTGIFSKLYDLQRLSSRITQNSFSPKDALALRTSLNVTRDLIQFEKNASMPALILGKLLEITTALNDLDSVLSLLRRGLSDNPPYHLKDGGTIREGFHQELDELRSIRRSAKTVIAAIENRERKETGITNLRVKYNRVFGYFLEVSSGRLNLVPDHYIRKQTLTNGERFITGELKELETKILTAQGKIETLENELFSDIRNTIFEHIEALLALADAISEIDVLCSLSTAAVEYGYVRPEIHEGALINIQSGRHPIIERRSRNPFVPNDTLLDDSSHNHIILTGPNMAGKSTIMRQVALISIMAQMGSFVPAESAKIGLIDRLFTRIGASDNLSGGDSTFMVEMKETGEILANATKRSLIILDEIGRGTSTFDGLSLAWAISEYIYKKIKARTLFATHYHELTNLPHLYNGMKNYNIAVRQKGDDIFFLYKLVQGGVNRSYGIHVARLANLPESVIRAAQIKLEELEASATNENQLSLFSPGELSFPYSEKDQQREEILSQLALFDITASSPLEALIFLEKMKSKLADFHFNPPGKKKE